MMNSNRPKAVREVMSENYRHQKRSPPAIQRIDDIRQFNDYYDEVDDKFKDELLYGSSLASENKAGGDQICVFAL